MSPRSNKWPFPRSLEFRSNKEKKKKEKKKRTIVHIREIRNDFFFLARQSRLVFVGQGNTQAHAQSNGETDEEDDESAPPLEATSAAGVLDTLADLLVTLLNVLDCALGVDLGGNNNILLLLDHSGEFLEEDSELGEGLLDALELVVASAHVAKERSSVAGAVGSKLHKVWSALVTHLYTRHTSYYLTAEE